MPFGGVDPVHYSHFHHPQERDVNDILSEAASEMGWSWLEDEVVLDVGCGPGNTSCAWILALFPRVKTVIGLDVSPEMIGLARVLNPHPRVEYIVADITDRSTVECWEGSSDKVFSFYCLQYVDDWQEALSNIYALLKPGGQAILMWENDSAYHKYYAILAENAKWTSLLKDTLHRFQKRITTFDNTKLKEKLQDIGFLVNMSRKIEKSFTFLQEEDCLGFLLSFCGKLPTLLTDDLMEQFRYDFLQILRQNGAQESAHHYSISYSLTSVLLMKPKQTSK